MQFELHLDAEIKRGIADHCNQVLGEITLAVDKVEDELFAAATPTTPTAYSFLSAAEALRWDTAVESHEKLYVELVTRNKSLASARRIAKISRQARTCERSRCRSDNYQPIEVPVLQY